MHVHIFNICAICFISVCVYYIYLIAQNPYKLVMKSLLIKPALQLHYSMVSNLFQIFKSFFFFWHVGS